MTPPNDLAGKDGVPGVMGGAAHPAATTPGQRAGRALARKLAARKEEISRTWLGWARDQFVPHAPPSLGVHVLNQLSDLLFDVFSTGGTHPLRLKRLARELHLCGLSIERTDALWGVLGDALHAALGAEAAAPLASTWIDLLITRCRGATARHYFEAADARLHFAEDELRSVLGSSRVAFTLVDNAGKIRVWNEGFRRLTGWAEDDVVGRVNIFALIPHSHDVHRILESLASGEAVDSFETSLRCSDGRDVPVSLSISLLKNQEGHPVGSVGVCFDTSEKVRLEEERRNRGEMLKQVVERSPFPMGVVGPGGRLLLASDALASLLGAPSADALCRDLDLVGDPRLVAAGLPNAIDRALAGQDVELPPVEIEVSRGADRHRALVSARLYPLAGEKGRGRAAVLALEDLTRQQFLQRQVIQAQKLSSVGQLLTGITHELNNKLCIILGYAEMLADAAREPALVRPVGYIANAANGARGIIESLSAFARPKEPRREVLDLNRIVRDTLVLVQVRASGRPLDVSIDLAADLPETAGDPEQLGQVFLNVCINALQAMEGREGAAIQVTSRVAADGFLEVVIDDHGPGIPEELIDRVFDPFFTTKEVGKGTGLGLSVSYAICRAHGGELVAGNRPGGGARFTLRLPRRNPFDSVEVTETPSVIPGSRERLRVLVADDEPMMCQLLVDWFTAREDVLEVQVDSARDGEQAVELLAGTRYDLLICDIRMPRIDGPTLYRWIQRHHPELAGKVLFTTGDTTDPATVEFLVETGSPCLPKPFNLVHLEDMVARVLEGEGGMVTLGDSGDPLGW